jgi:inner membrane protein
MTITTEPADHDAPTPRWAAWLQTPAAKGTMIVVLALGLLIPLRLVDQVNQDRAAHQEEARLEYQKSWGPSQSVLGPLIFVPYTIQADQVRHYLNIAPRRLLVTSRLQPELRRRGLFRAIVYQARVELNGEFSLARDGLPIPADAHLYW